jgi:uncharacterized membrane protein
MSNAEIAEDQAVPWIRSRSSARTKFSAQSWGTAYGFLNFLSGLATLAAGAIAGAPWDLTKPAAAYVEVLVFHYSTFFSLIAVRQKMHGSVSEVIR